MDFIARQPIFDTRERVVGYELLFRSSEENRCVERDLDLASRKMMSTAMLMGLDVLSGGYTIYLNCTEELLCGRYPTLFPASQTVVEVLETVTPSTDVVAACKELKEAGYRIALDDFEDLPSWSELIQLADVIKVDFRLISSVERGALIKKYGNNGRLLLAEKVETNEEFESASQQGYRLFQGYFFCKPKVLSTKSLSSLNPQHLRLLRMLGNPTLDFHDVEELVKMDPALCLRLLRYLNSSIFGFHGEIKSILQALTLLGEGELRKWLLLMSAVIAGQKNSELIRVALVRARFAELLCTETAEWSSSLFLLGLLSLSDAIFDMPRKSIVESLAMPAALRSALLGFAGPFRDYLDLIQAYERADWDRCDLLARSTGVPMTSMSSKYMEALAWAEGVVNSSPAPYLR